MPVAGPNTTMPIIQQMNDHRSEIDHLKSRVTDLEEMVRQMADMIGVDAQSLIPPRPAPPPPNHEMQAKSNLSNLTQSQIIGTRNPNF